MMVKIVDEKLVLFFYLLARDHLPFGTIIEIINSISNHKTFHVTNDSMVEWAKDMADRIKTSG